MRLYTLHSVHRLYTTYSAVMAYALHRVYLVYTVYSVYLVYIMYSGALYSRRGEGLGLSIRALYRLYLYTGCAAPVERDWACLSVPFV
jgi:hypothetical protein